MNRSPLTPKRRFACNKSSVIDRILINDRKERMCKFSAAWAAINVAVVAALLYDLSFKCPFKTTLFNYFEYILLIVCSLNVICHVLRYIYLTLRMETVAVTPDQKRLLGLRDGDSSYKIANISQSGSKCADSMQKSFSPAPFNKSAVSWCSGNTSGESHNLSMSSSSWVYSAKSPESKQQSLNASGKLPLPDTSGVEFITDEGSMSQYLQDYQNHEKSMLTNTSVDQQSNLLRSFWSHPASQNPADSSPFLRKYQYNLSSQMQALATSGSPVSKAADDFNSSLVVNSQGMEIWHKLNVEYTTLTQWNANLRLWISLSVLDRIVKEMERVNKALLKQHLHDVQIGSVGLERLRKTAQTVTVVQCIPSLPFLVPFLEVTTNQEYLVKRIRELSTGGCMSQFKWNAGGNFNGKEWDDSLPTDAAIILHLWASYMDTQLFPLPNQPDARPFSSLHLVKSNERGPVNPNTIAIHQVTEKPPHFRLIVGEEVHEVVKGRNNLFHVVLLFLYYVNKREHGMLGRVNLGRSGVNMMWIIDK